MPKEPSKVTLGVEGAWRGGTEIPGFAAQVLEFTIGNGEVCDALECAAANMKKNEKAMLTVTLPALVAEARLGLQDAGASSEPIVLAIEMKEFEKAKESWDMSEEDKLTFCSERKAIGNSLFKAGRLDLALARYKKVVDVFSYIDNYQEEVKIKAKELKQVCELNKAMCYLKMKDYAEAKGTCNTVLKDDKGNVKALYRRAQAEYGLKEFEECIRDCKSAAESDPQNKEVRALLKQAKEGQKEVDKKAKGMYSQMVKAFGTFKERANVSAPFDKLGDEDSDADMMDSNEDQPNDKKDDAPAAGEE